MSFNNFKMHEAMVDLETLATTKDAHILSIGIVSMTDLSNCLYFTINKGQSRYIDPSTIFWWSSQSKEARDQAFNQKGSIQLEIALDMITQWFQTYHIKKIWSHGATFDVAILEDAYRQFDRVPPWKFWDVRDTRTLIDLAERATGSRLQPVREGTYHNALDDAKHQAQWINNILEIFKQ